LEIELWFYLMRLYPKRSIASHRFCGSGRLFPGLLEETRRAESDMTWLMTERLLADDIKLERRKDIPSLSACQGFFANLAIKPAHLCKTVSQMTELGCSKCK